MKIKLKGQYNSRRVWLDGKELDPKRSQQINNHSPDGFAWGYGGSGPSQLALAICLELFPEATARAVYQDFKWAYIAELPEDSFETVIDISVFKQKIQEIS